MSSWMMNTERYFLQVLQIMCGYGGRKSEGRSETANLVSEDTREQNNPQSDMIISHHTIISARRCRRFPPESSRCGFVDALQVVGRVSGYQAERPVRSLRLLESQGSNRRCAGNGSDRPEDKDVKRRRKKGRDVLDAAVQDSTSARWTHAQNTRIQLY